MHVGETRRSVRFRKREHFDVVRTFNAKKSRAYRRHVAESFLINQRAHLLNVINCNEGADFPAV